MNRSNAYRLIPPVGFLAIIAIVLFACKPAREKLKFANLAEAKSAVEKAGLVVSVDNSHGWFNGGFAISKEAVPMDRVLCLHKGSSSHPSFDGLIWISYNDESGYLTAIPEGAQLWGSVYVIGDPALLKEVEAKLESAP